MTIDQVEVKLTSCVPCSGSGGNLYTGEDCEDCAGTGFVPYGVHHGENISDADYQRMVREELFKE